MSLIEYLRKDLKLSAKTVFAQFPRYISFVVVLLFVSMLFCTVSTLHFNLEQTQRKYLESRYVSNDGDLYHFQLIGLNQQQYSLIRQFDQEQSSENEVFKIVGGIESSISGTIEKRYDLDVQLVGDPDSAFDAFVGQYTAALNDSSENYSIIKTPLLDYELSEAKNTVIYVLLVALIVAAGVLALWVLHSTMINHYKFTYGIYMTFGATFRRLFLTAFWEQFWIVLLTWLPSSLIGMLVSWLIFRQTGLNFTVYGNAFPWSLLLSLLTVGIAVFLSIRSASAKTPSALIAAADNSNLIHSPRISYDLIGASFPGTIGRITFRRYWKYILRLMAGTLAFSMLFVSATTIGDCYERVLSLDIPEISVSFDIPIDSTEGEEGQDSDDSLEAVQYGYNSEKQEVFGSLDHIKTIVKRGYTQAMSLTSHVKVNRKATRLFSDGVYLDGMNGDYKCFLNVDYNTLDDEVITSFEALGYKVEGSLDSVLNDEKTVAVTAGYLGATQFDWEIGDKIMIADLPDAATRTQLIAKANALLTADTDKLLNAWLQETEFTYTEYTIGAIISEIPTEQNWAVYFSEEDYKNVTGRDAIYNELDIYADTDATEEEIKDLYYQLRHVADYYTNMTVTDLDSATSRTMELNKNYSSIIAMLSFVLLAVCPLFWFFSQALFYMKRQQELELLQSMGASSSAIKRYLMDDAIRFSITGGILFAVLAPVVSWLMHRLVGYIMVFAGDTMLASFKLPIAAYIAGILINIVCGFASGYVAWLMYRKHRSAVFGENKTSDDVSNQPMDTKEASV